VKEVVVGAKTATRVGHGMLVQALPQFNLLPFSVFPACSPDNDETKANRQQLMTLFEICLPSECA
jgi:hypothetical protein